ncbi:hypothetical protein PI126_g6900 [Phytophthora idaei]|nr:hypothetical protein PI126_g6900 [Phytophthora idaei]
MSPTDECTSLEALEGAQKKRKVGVFEDKQSSVETEEEELSSEGRVLPEKRPFVDKELEESARQGRRDVAGEGCHSPRVGVDWQCLQNALAANVKWRPSGGLRNNYDQRCSSVESLVSFIEAAGVRNAELKCRQTSRTEDM